MAITLIPILLCGGNGTRLWPISRRAKPKQFLPLLNPSLWHNSIPNNGKVWWSEMMATKFKSNLSLFQLTILRIVALTQKIEPMDINIAKPMAIGHYDHRFFIHDQLQEIDVAAEILLEPMAKDSAPAMVAACHYIQAHRLKNENSVVLALPCDHYIEHLDFFFEAIIAACKKLEKTSDAIITFGIMPHQPSKNYGYMKPKADPKMTLKPKVLAIADFKEKPDTATAKEYIAKGYFWNSGIFMFRPESMLRQYQTVEPNNYQLLLQAVQAISPDPLPDWNFNTLARAAYQTLKAQSFDYAVMEKTKLAYMVQPEPDRAWGWSDLGSFDEIYRLNPKDVKNNVILNWTTGDEPLVAAKVNSPVSSGISLGASEYLDNNSPLLQESYDNLIINHSDKLITLLHVNDLVVVVTQDALLLANKNDLTAMKKLVTLLEQQKPEVTEFHHQVHRPWGYYQSLKIDAGYQVKKLSLKPKAKISLQKHQHRSEHWVVVKGLAKVTLADQELELHPNQSVYIEKGMVHRLENIGTGNLELIEVQTGDYLGEDDIERLEDVYSR